MNKQFIIPVIALLPLTSMTTAVQAEGFIEDSKATLSLRNLYYNNDYRKSRSNPKQDEWGQAFRLDFQSGYTQGVIGFGIDAVGLYGVKLDGGGKSGSNTSSRNPAQRPAPGTCSRSTVKMRQSMSLAASV